MIILCFLKIIELQTKCKKNIILLKFIQRMAQKITSLTKRSNYFHIFLFRRYVVAFASASLL